MNLKTYVGNWSRFDLIYLIIFTTIIFWASLSFIDPTKPDWFNIINITSAVSGIICVILVTKKNILNFPIGIINAITYGYIAYAYHWNGSMILNWFIFLPFQFIGWHIWNHNLNIDTGEVTRKYLPLKYWTFIAPASITCILIDAYILRSLPYGN